MAESERYKKKFHSALKLHGFSVRREFCSFLVDKFLEENVDLSNNPTFDNCLKTLCSSLENQCLSERSIEREHIERALEVCLHSGYDKDECIFTVINAFDFPKLTYDPDRKQYFIDNQKAKLLSDPSTKSTLFLNRYQTILQRTKRNFKDKLGDQAGKVELQTVDYLLTVSHVSLNHILILGSLLQVSEGKYSLEDPTGIVQLDLSHAVYYGGIFVENCFVLVNGVYEDKILKVSTLVLPPGEEYRDSRPSFGNLNYFGGVSTVPQRDSNKLREHLEKNPSEMILFFSNVWLDHPSVFEKLEVLFEGFDPNPPIAFVFMGNFLSEFHNADKIQILKKLFKRLAELINKHANLVIQSNFIFVPGLEDPSVSHIVPRFPLPSTITEEVTKIVKKAVFTTSPCRIQYCTREITVFRADLLPKLLQAALHKPKSSEVAQNFARTIISQGHLAPLSLNALPVHWDFDYTLQLYPLPDLIVVGDKSEMYQEKYKECQVVNPGSFCENGFQFKAYTPSTNTTDDCVL